MYIFIYIYIYIILYYFYRVHLFYIMFYIYYIFSIYIIHFICILYMHVYATAKLFNSLVELKSCFFFWKNIFICSNFSYLRNWKLNI